MYRIINKSVQAFLRHYHGEATWEAVAYRIHIDAAGFEPLLHYDPAVTEMLLTASCRVLRTNRMDLLEDVGTYLGTLEPLRRLLRFGGVDYVEFLFSLDELQERAVMAMPDLGLPRLNLIEFSPTEFVVEVVGVFPGWAAVLAGLMRTMADDYGSLVYIETIPADEKGMEQVSVQILESEFADARTFALSRPNLREHVQ